MQLEYNVAAFLEYFANQTHMNTVENSENVFVLLHSLLTNTLPMFLL